MRNFIEGGYAQGRTFPEASSGSRLIHRPPATPIPKVDVLNAALTHVPVNGHGTRIEGAITTPITHQGRHGENHSVMRLIPVIGKPLTPPFYTAAGGGRFGGGGTSPEAIRRARKKARNNHRP